MAKANPLDFTLPARGGPPNSIRQIPVAPLLCGFWSLGLLVSRAFGLSGFLADRWRPPESTVEFVCEPVGREARPLSAISAGGIFSFSFSFGFGFSLGFWPLAGNRRRPARAPPQPAEANWAATASVTFCSDYQCRCRAAARREYQIFAPTIDQSRQMLLTKANPNHSVFRSLALWLSGSPGLRVCRVSGWS